MRYGVLTVAELITELQKYPGEAVVCTEGCDCYGSAVGVEFDAEGFVYDSTAGETRATPRVDILRQI